MKRLHVGEFNDSFPPTIDGVAQTVKNYATILQKNHCDVTVVTPSYKGVVDHYPFDVFRYHSIPLDKRIGYRAGNPFSPDTLLKLRARHFDLMHIHAPFASSVLVKNINFHPRVPVVLTYHTMFDIDIKKRVRLPEFRKIAMRFLLENIKAVDEVWVVTKGCGEALRRIGYRGGYRVMENGTDFAFGKAEEDRVESLRQKYGVKDDEFVFLFVGRMMWYKNVRLILDTLSRAKKAGLPFRAFMVGDGYDAPDIRAYSEALGMQEQVTFTGPVYDREKLRVYYSMADIFLFPSTYDTSGIVVKEAAACECPALLVRGSCASEGIEQDFTGFLAEENADDCARVLLDACQSRDNPGRVGRNAGEHIYLSWDTAVDRAYQRYTEILQKWPGPLPYNAKKIR
ncbi:MAG: glycosyltransferase family 4 protein [Clostridiales bacterium]|jgi:1,2-diacylglycerol 3-alpha-glucosyltransferase|nr:glycosyltransferase family 4 protein [Clostridiales bacterium]